MKRRPVALACAVFGLLGLAAGLFDLRRLALFPLERLEALQRLPRPRGTFWLDDAQGFLKALESWERPLMGAAVLLFICGFALLASILNPHFRLLKPADENPGSGLLAHLERPRLVRFAASALLSMWLAGAFAPVGAVLWARAAAAESRGALSLLSLGVGGLPTWTAFLPGVSASVLHSLLLGVLIVLLWGPGGLSSPKRELPFRAILVSAVSLGAFLYPAVVGLTSGRSWLFQAAGALSLADREAWLWLAGLALALPAAATAAVPLAAWAFRPRAGSTRAALGIACASVLFLSLTAAAAAGAPGGLRLLDIGYRTLAERVPLQSTEERRVALILGPRRRVFYSAPINGSNQDPAPSAACTPENAAAVEEFIARSGFRSALLFPAFVHLHDCASLEWDTTGSLELDLRMLEGAPSPLAAELLLEKLLQCSTGPENRRVLDHLADPARFRWPEPMRQRVLGTLYLRFGDPERARSFLLDRKAGLSEDELRSIWRGTPPLADGVVRGRLRIENLPAAGVRVGLVDADARRRPRGRPNWVRMIGSCRAFEWRHVAAAGRTDSSGAFEIRNVPEGRYILVVSAPGIKGGLRPVASGHPGIVELDAFRPVRSLAPVQIRFLEPVDVPGGRPNAAVARAARLPTRLALR